MTTQKITGRTRLEPKSPTQYSFHQLQIGIPAPWGKLCLLVSFYLSPGIISSIHTISILRPSASKRVKHTLFGQDHAGIWSEPGFSALLLWTGLQLWAHSLLRISNGMQPWGLSDGPEPAPGNDWLRDLVWSVGRGRGLSWGERERPGLVEGLSTGGPRLCESHADSCSPALRKPKHRSESARVFIYR